MRRSALATAATLAVLAAASFAPSQANAMALSTPAGIQAAIDTTSLAQDVAYVAARFAVAVPVAAGFAARASGPVAAMAIAAEAIAVIAVIAAGSSSR